MYTGVLTYGDAIKFAQEKLGDCCASMTPASWDLVCRNVLQVFLDGIGPGETPETRTDLTTIPNVSVYSVAGDVVAVRRGALLLPYGTGVIYDPEHEEPKGAPTSWEVINEQLVLRPTPDGTYFVTVVTKDPQATSVTPGEQIALPVELHPLFAKMLAGYVLIDIDQPRGAVLVQMADSEFQRWRTARNATKRRRFSMNQRNHRYPQPGPGHESRYVYVLPEDL